MTFQMRSWISWMVGVGAIAQGVGCGGVKCGSGTFEVDGQCVAGVLVGDGGVECGPGTHFDLTSGVCVNDLVDTGGECGPNTVRIINDAGVPVCVGTFVPGDGGTLDCNSLAPPCPAPAAGNATIVCGRVFDLLDSVPINEKVAAGELALDDIEVRLYEPLSFIGMPGSAVPLDVVPVDACGYFVSNEVATPFTKLIAVGIDDRRQDGVPIADEFILGGIAAEALPGQKIENRRTFFARHSLVESWSASAAIGDPDFEERGIYVPIYIDTTVPSDQWQYPFPGIPKAGVVIADASGTPVDPTRDFYFTDSDPLMRTVVDPALTTTGINGTGIAIGLSLNTYGGVGQEPPGCTWSENQAASVPGVIFVQEKPSQCAP